jgi:hypothetical protein
MPESSLDLLPLDGPSESSTTLVQPKYVATAEGDGDGSWFRNLKGGRLEVCLKGSMPEGSNMKMRASGLERDVWKMVTMFEEMTGREVVGDWKRPPRSGARPIAGQLDIEELLDGTE